MSRWSCAVEQQKGRQTPLFEVDDTSLLYWTPAVLGEAVMCCWRSDAVAAM